MLSLMLWGSLARYMAFCTFAVSMCSLHESCVLLYVQVVHP